MNLDRITQQYLEIFPGDFSENPRQRQTPKILFATTDIVHFKNPELIAFNGQHAGKEMARFDQDLFERSQATRAEALSLIFARRD